MSHILQTFFASLQTSKVTAKHEKQIFPQFFMRLTSNNWFILSTYSIFNPIKAKIMYKKQACFKASSILKHN